MKVDIKELFLNLNIVIWATIFSLLLSLWIADVIYPYLGLGKPRFVPSDKVSAIRKPYPYIAFSGASNTEIGKWGTSNDVGFRGPSPTAAKKQGEIRVFMLGGSTVFAGEPPLAVLIEEELRKLSNRDVRVFNFGVVSSISGMEVARTIMLVSKYQPDVVLFYNGGNDIMHPLGYDPRPGYPYNYFVHESTVFLKPTNSYPVFSLIAFRSNFLRQIFSDYFTNTFFPKEALREKVGHGTGAWRQAIVDEYISNIKRGHIVARGMDAEFINFFQPMSHYTSMEKLSKRYDFSEPSDDYQLNSSLHVLDTRMRLRNGFSQLSPELQKRVVDMSDFYIHEEVKEIYKDSIHTKQSAKPAAAKYISQEIFTRFPDVLK